MTLMDILKRLPTKPVLDYGSIILYTDILQYSKLYGQDNQDYIDALLKKLDEQGLIKIVYHKTPGYEDLIVGAILN